MKGLSTGDKAFTVVLYIVTGILLLCAIYPLYFVLIASFSNPTDVVNGKVWVLPYNIDLAGYKRIMEHEPLWTGYRNTIFYTVCFTALALAVTIPCAYAMSRKPLMLRGPIMFYFTVPMFFGGGLIPTYLVVKNIGLLNNPLVMIIPACFGVYNMIISRTFFQTTIPEELHDAGTIDGCGEARFFFQIAAPLSKAIIAVIGLYYAVQSWNSYFDGLIYLSSANLKPLQLVLRDILVAVEFNTRQGSSAASSLGSQAMLKESIKYCTIVVSTLPILMVYPFIQKYFTQGVMIGAIKG